MKKRDRLWAMFAIVYIILANLIVGTLDFRQEVAEHDHSIVTAQAQAQQTQTVSANLHDLRWRLDMQIDPQ